jgi:hypothetical protein
MKLLITISFCLFYFLSLGQQLGNNTLYTSKKDTSSVFISLSSEGYYASSIFNNEFIDKFINGGFIDEKLKEEALSKAKQLNHIGGEFNVALNYSNPKSYLFKNWGFYTGLSYNYNLGTQFTGDLYQLIFHGNKGLESKEAVLSPSAFYLRDANQFSFGLNKKNQLKIGLTFSSFNNNTGAELTKGQLYTEANGAELTIDVEGNYFGVDTNKSVQFLSNNAIGIGLDFETTLKLKENENSQKIYVGVKNIGVLIHQNAYQISAKRNYSFKGIEVDNLSNISTGLLTSESIQDSLGIETKIESRTTLLPFEIYFFQAPSYNKRLEVIYGFRYRNESAYKAFLYAGGNVKINNKVSASTYISHGGYTNLQWGLSSQVRLNDLYVGLNTNNVLGFFSKKAFGKALGISLTYLL